LILQQTDILVNGFYYESFGLSMVECMNASACVIGRRACAIPEVLGNGKYGILFDDYAEVSEIICGLLKDENLLRDYQKRAFEGSMRFSMREFENNLLKLYDDVIH